MPRITVIPADGRRVRNDVTGAVVPDSGEEVESSIYWYRREMAGDITVEQTTKAAPTKAPKKG